MSTFGHNVCICLSWACIDDYAGRIPSPARSLLTGIWYIWCMARWLKKDFLYLGAGHRKFLPRLPYFWCIGLGMNCAESSRRCYKSFQSMLKALLTIISQYWLIAAFNVGHHVQFLLNYRSESALISMQSTTVNILSVQMNICLNRKQQAVYYFQQDLACVCMSPGVGQQHCWEYCQIRP